MPALLWPCCSDLLAQSLQVIQCRDWSWHISCCGRAGSESTIRGHRERAITIPSHTTSVHHHITEIRDPDDSTSLAIAWGISHGVNAGHKWPERLRLVQGINGQCLQIMPLNWVMQGEQESWSWCKEADFQLPVKPKQHVGKTWPEWPLLNPFAPWEGICL